MKRSCKRQKAEKVMTAFLLGVLVVTSLSQKGLSEWKQLQCQGRAISRRYFNSAEGFSLAMPSGHKGRAGQAAGPERGVSIPLSRDCKGVVVVYGEANSFEWQTPVDAIKWEVDSEMEDDPHAEVHRYKTRLGKLKAAAVTVRHRATDEVEDMV